MEDLLLKIPVQTKRESDKAIYNYLLTVPWWANPLNYKILDTNILNQLTNSLRKINYDLTDVVFDTIDKYNLAGGRKYTELTYYFLSNTLDMINQYFRYD